MLGPSHDSRRVIPAGGPKRGVEHRGRPRDGHRHTSFINVSSHPCTLVGYPRADLVTPAGGVLINVSRRPAAAAHRLTLAPNEVAHADIQSYAIDTSTGNDCARWGTVVVTPPNDFQSHTLNVDLPICSASVSSVDWSASVAAEL